MFCLPSYIGRSEYLILYHFHDRVHKVLQLISITELIQRNIVSFITPTPELIERNIHRGCEELEIEPMVVGFLFARHAGQEGRHLFPSYAQWFSSLFSPESTSPASQKQSFVFLVRCTLFNVIVIKIIIVHNDDYNDRNNDISNNDHAI